jgi:hypothetical protein
MFFLPIQGKTKSHGWAWWPKQPIETHTSINFVLEITSNVLHLKIVYHNYQYYVTLLTLIKSVK